MIEYHPMFSNHTPCKRDKQTQKEEAILQNKNWPSTPTGQAGALVGASKYCKIAWSAFMMEIEKPEERQGWEYHYFLMKDKTISMKTKITI